MEATPDQLQQFRIILGEPDPWIYAVKVCHIVHNSDPIVVRMVYNALKGGDVPGLVHEACLATLAKKA